ncbi:glycosyltransferase [Nitratidesulfovibrio sp.]|uniref:glycosyltransferase n=1 Tax=Nitratidesulfovibrio sp. TaxID=2802297 RepID=UPI003342C57C
MQLLFRLAPGGAERLALTTLDKARGRVRGSVCGLFGSTGPLVPEIEQMGLPWFGLDVIGHSRLRGIWTLAALLRREKVDVVHAQAAYLLQWAVPAAWLSGARVVYTEHSRHQLESQPRVRRLLRMVGPWLSDISCVTEDMRRFLKNEVGMAVPRIRVIRNGVDVARYAPAEPGNAVAAWPAGWGTRSFVFGNVARFCEAKDHPSLLRAFDAVSRVHPYVRLLLVGDGECRPEVEALHADLGLGDAVHFAGTRQDIPEHLRAMGVFVLSSRVEGMPVAVLEAMACGVPVVTTDVGGLGELVRDGETARVVPPRDPEALAGAMRWMLENPREREAMRLRALDMVRSQCGHDTMLRGYLDLYGVKEARA